MAEFLGVDLWSFWGLLMIFSGLVLGAYFWPALNKLPLINGIPKQTKLWVGIGGIVLLLILGPMSIPFTADVGSTAEDVDYYNTSDVDISAYNAQTGSLLGSEDVRIYESGYDDADYAKETGEADILRTATLSSGEATVNAMDAEQYNSVVFMLDDSGYYQTFTEEDIRVERSLDDNTVGVTIRATDIGTIDTSKTSGSDLGTGNHEVTLFFGNSESDSEIRFPAIKVDNTTDMSVESVESGGQLVEVDSTKYIVPDENTIEGGDYATVSININIEADGNQGMGIVYDDLFQQFGADSFPTDSDIQSVGSSSQTLVFH